MVKRVKMSGRRRAMHRGRMSGRPWLHPTKGWRGDGLRQGKTNRRRRR